MNFADKIIEAIKEKQNPTCAGLDTDLKKIPNFLKEKYKNEFKETFEAAGRCIFDFNKKIIDGIYDIVPAVKIQIAFYEEYGMWGIWAFEETIKYAKQKKLMIIIDAKRNDIGNTAKAYSNAILGKVDLFGKLVPSLDVDCVTVNGYLGSDGVVPFIEDCMEYGKGIFVLVKTSNPSSGELQDLKSDNETFYEVMANNVNKWGEEVIGKSGYSSIGAVVGATYPNEAIKLRKIMSNAIFLVPGYGAQGGGAKDTLSCFNKDGFGAIVNNSRGLIFAYKKHNKPEKEFVEEARKSAILMKEDLTNTLKDAGICSW